MKIKNVKQANEALYRIAEIESTVSVETALKEEAERTAAQMFQAKTEPLESEKETLVKALCDFTSEHRAELIPQGKNSADIGSGTLGYRKSPDKVEITKNTAELLIQCGMGAMVKVTKEPIKAALKNLGEDELAKVEAKKVPGTEQFFAKANEIRYTETQETVA